MIWPVLARGLKRQLRVAAGQKLPVIAGHKLLYRCNLRCDMCPFWRRTDEPLLRMEDERRLMSRLADAGVLFMGFEGGEPLLRPDLPPILEEAHERFHTSLVTNGFLLARRLPEIVRHLDLLAVSIDGIGPLHDRLRGVPGAYDRAIEGIRAARERVPVVINSTLTRTNLSEATRIVDLARALDVGVVFQVAFDYSTAIGLSPNGRELPPVLDQLRRLKREGDPILNSRAYFDNVLRSWYEGGDPWECRPWLTINVDPSGRIVLPCYVLKEYGGDRTVWDTDIPSLWGSIDWRQYRTCNRCALSCYMEPSLFRWSSPSLVKERLLDPFVDRLRERRGVTASGASAAPHAAIP